MADHTRSSLSLQPLLPWITVLLLSALAWIPTFQQAWHMYALALPQFGTMGLSAGPFLLFWTLMMAAMMFPALASTVATRYQQQVQQTSHMQALSQMVLFLMGYLSIWTLFGWPVFLLARLGEQFVLSSPALASGLGIALLLVVGIYQMTPLAMRHLRHCHPLFSCDARQTSMALSSQLRAGLIHGLHCLSCCGGLMLIMVAVGLMNLPWMVLITIVILLEKTWHQGIRLSFFVGFSLLVFAMLALAVPALLAGLYRPV